ncbi:hypothetical protein D3C73_815970 [compost metagenome]
MSALYNRSCSSGFAELFPCGQPLCRKNLINAHSRIVKNRIILVRHIYRQYFAFHVFQIAEEHRHPGIFLPIGVLLGQIELHIGIIQRQGSIPFQVGHIAVNGIRSVGGHLTRPLGGIYQNGVEHGAGGQIADIGDGHRNQKYKHNNQLPLHWQVSQEQPHFAKNPQDR